MASRGIETDSRPRGQLIPGEAFVFQRVRNDQYIVLQDGIGANGGFSRDLTYIPPDS